MSKGMRWKDSLRPLHAVSDDMRLRRAALQLTEALNCQACADERRKHVEFFLAMAGWLIREERRRHDKVAAVPSVRENLTYEGRSPETLLWRALAHVAVAARWGAHTITGRSQLRLAEACLREHWKATR